MRFRSLPDQRGSATVFGVAFVGLLTTVALVGASVTALLVGHRRAASGADLAALAGASAVQRARPGCEQAAVLAAANRVRLVRCAISGDVVSVEVAIEIASALGPSWTVRARARAGPAL